MGGTAVTTHRLAKLDELWPERPFPTPPPLEKQLNAKAQRGKDAKKNRELWAERPFPPHHLAKLDELWDKTAVSTPPPD